MNLIIPQKNASTAAPKITGIKRLIMVSVYWISSLRLLMVSAKVIRGSTIERPSIIMSGFLIIYFICLHFEYSER